MTDFNPIEFIKIYIGQLPLDFEEHHLRALLDPLAPLKEVKIIKGDNTRGRFDLFCYAFVTMRGNEAFAHEVIKKVQQQYPNWKMNVKHDLDRKRPPKNYQQPSQVNYPPPMPMPYHTYPPVHYQQPYMGGPHPHPQHQAPSQKIIGEKPCNIMVRELWLGGIPENFSKAYLGQLMAYYGIIEQIEMFPKFAFVKFKQVPEATAAFERAEEICQRLGSPPGFRIFFSDPSRRAYVVSNNYQFERKSPHVPIVFIGFPPVTSATVEIDVIKPVVEKVAPVVSEYMRKSTNSQNRSYFLFSMENVQNAIRVKQQLNRRKDQLGDKRAQVAVLIDESVIMKNKDFQNVERMFQSDPHHEKRRNPSPYYADIKGHYGDMKGQGMMMPHPQMNYPVYPGRMGLPPNPYMPYYPQHPPPYFYPEQPFFKPEEERLEIYQNNNSAENKNNEDAEGNENIHDLLKDVLGSDKGTGYEKKPEKSETGREEDILSKLLGSESGLKEEKGEKEEGERQGGKKEEGGKEEGEKEGRKQERDPSWSGFLTWKGQKRVEVDGFSRRVELEEYSINVVSLVEFKDMAVRDKHTMVLEGGSKMGRQTFEEYRRALRERAGVAMSKEYLMYLMGKGPGSDRFEEDLREDELLVVMEKASTLSLIKDKLIKSEELA